MKDTALVRSAWETIRRFALIRPGQKVLAAVSGGRDSVALLSVLGELATRLDISVAAAHVNHHLRAGADEDEELVRSHCESSSIAFLRADLDPNQIREGDGGLEAVARRERMCSLETMARQCDAAVIATAHHREDQAETVLYRAARGAGSAGLAAIRPVAGVFIRPFLFATRVQIDNHLSRRGLTYRNDESNLDLRFARNRIRHAVLPAIEETIPGAAAALARLAEVTACEAEVLAECAEADLAQAGNRNATGAVLDVPALLRLSAARRRVLLHHLVRDLGGPHVEWQTIAMIDRVVHAASPSGLADIGGGWVARREYDRLYIERAAERPVSIGDVALPVPGVLLLPGGRLTARAEDGPPATPPTHECAVLDPALLSGALAVRSVRDGDRYSPFGFPGEKKISDLLVDAKVPRRLRQLVPVIEDRNGIVWVAGYPPARWAAHPLDSRAALVLAYEPVGNTK